MKATLQIAVYAVAKQFVESWNRYSCRGYTLGAKNANGGSEVILYGVTAADKEWIDNRVKTLNEMEEYLDNH